MKTSDLSHARNFLKIMSHENYTPEAIKAALFLKSSTATIGRKLRQYARDGMLIRSYYRNPAGEEIAQYSWNPAYDAHEPALGNNGEPLPNHNPEPMDTEQLPLF